MKTATVLMLFCSGMLLFGMIGCREKEGTSPYKNPAFAAYWDQGKAEITSYRLQQARYGELHEGSAVIIFVTEDFSRKKQVKLDDPFHAKGDAVHVLKMNMTKYFVTGIYPYSMMVSVFTPVKGNGHPVKVTATNQEWCGHTFTQFNLHSYGYRVQLHSYFESEGEQQFKMSMQWLEDAVWTQIRLNPQALPKGNILMVPGSLSQRLRHSVIREERALASMDSLVVPPSWLATKGSLSLYTVQYPEQKRVLKIYFQTGFPHQILGWEELYPDGPQHALLSSRAVRDRSILLDYWNHNKNSDLPWRDSLNLPK